MHERVINTGNPKQKQKKILKSPSKFDSLSSLVRDIYCLHYRLAMHQPNYGVNPIPKWDGGTDRYGTAHKAIWPKIVKFIMDIDADPWRYIKSQFEYDRAKKPPFPNQLINKEALRKWKQVEDTAMSSVVRLVSSDINQVSLAKLPLISNLKWDESAATTYVLNNMNVRISPLMRFALAASNDIKLSEQLENAAFEQYIFQTKLYDTLIPCGVPTVLKDKAKLFINSLEK